MYLLSNERSITTLIAWFLITFTYSTIPAGNAIGQATNKDSAALFSERQKERNRLVNRGIKKRGVSDPHILKAMRSVPRHLFIPKPYRTFAYRNRPLPIGYDQTISQPYIVALMTQMLDLNAGEKVLEIGTGSGYQAAVLAELTPYVFTIEIVEELGRQAQTRFDLLGYRSIQTKIGNGYQGWPKHAPFDAILLTAAPETIPQPLIDQLKVGGVLVAPVGKAGQVQWLTKVVKSQSGEIKKERKTAVRFVPMTRESEKNGTDNQR